MDNTTTTKPIEGQKPGTSGLRKKTKVFMQPHYLQNFVQSIFNAIGGIEGKSIAIGGDGRFYGQEATQIITKMAIAGGAKRLIIGQNALFSTPAVSNIIRKYQLDGGIILSASHNPGGENEDFGVKFNGPNGGPANEELSEKIFSETKSITSYQIAEMGDLDLASTGSHQIQQTLVEVFDPVEDYAILMREIFDFDKISAMFAGGFTMRFDAMNAITGPYATKILEEQLGAAKGTVVNATPLPDFGGLHPDPNPHWAKGLMDLMASNDAPDFGAASDGDGDRNMIVGQGFYVVPSDSLSILAEHAREIPAYSQGLKGVARSMPTGASVDHVAKALGIECFETPTGWKFFGNLLDAGKVTFCGEESFGTGSDHVREKDGLWAVLAWLNILAATGLSVSALQEKHWARFGRTFFSRHDYEAIASDKADAMMKRVLGNLDALTGQTHAGLTITSADEFAYDDPVDGSRSEHQGLRVFFNNGSRFVARLSGTGTEGATLRLYHELYESDPAQFDQDAQAALAPVIQAAREVLAIEASVDRNAPDVIT